MFFHSDLLVVQSRVLGLDSRQPRLDGVVEYLGEGLALLGLPGTVLEPQVGRSHLQLEDVHVPPELWDWHNKWAMIKNDLQRYTCHT